MTQQHQISLLQERDTTRLEAFSDGVFAIAITLLVLNIRIPGTPHLGQALRGQWALYLAYLLSFLTILNMLVFIFPLAPLLIYFLLMLFYLVPALSLPEPEKLYRGNTADQQQPEVQEMPS